MEDAASMDLAKKKIEGEKCIVVSNGNAPYLLYTYYIPIFLGLITVLNLLFCVFCIFHPTLFKDIDLVQFLRLIVVLLVLYVFVKYGGTPVRSFTFLKGKVLFESFSGLDGSVDLDDVKMLRVKKTIMNNNIEVILDRNDKTKLVIYEMNKDIAIERLQDACESNNIVFSYRKDWVSPVLVVICVGALLYFEHALFS